MNKLVYKAAALVWKNYRSLFYKIVPSKLPWYPLGIQIEITTKCNLRCKMCPNRGFGDFKMVDIPIDTYASVLRQSLPEIEYVYMWGVGEPTSHPKFLEMVRMAKQFGLKISFSTNGTFLNKNMAEKIVKWGVDEIIFSIDSADPKLYNKIRKGAKFDKVIDNLRTLLKIKKERDAKVPNVSITCSLMKINLDEMPKLVELAHDLGVPKVWFQNVISWDSFTKDQSLLGFQDRKKINRIFSETQKLAKEKGVWIRLPKFTIVGKSVCGFPWFGPINVRWDGSVTLCPWIAYPTHMYFVKKGNKVVKQHIMFRPWVMGNVHQQPLKSIWNNEKYQQMRLLLKKSEQPYPCNMCLHQFQVIC